jgi:SAM-dependent methyltransferase
MLINRVFRRVLRLADDLQFEREIPPLEINYNQRSAKSRAEYAREFKHDACLKELPFLVQRANLSSGSSILDYGCGFGRLAYAASKYLNSEGCFFGYEINPTALAFLGRAYADSPNFHFGGNILRRSENYIAIKEHTGSDDGARADDIDLRGLVKGQVDAQWSHSVFTHMWIEPIIATLKSVNAVLAPDALCINTWLIVDDYAAYVLRCGMADRELPHRVNGAYTYSVDNPLMCTGYGLDTMIDIYDRAGHEIIEILWGSWAGRENNVTYQDIVISRPRP